MMHFQFLIVTKLIFNEYFMSQLNSYSFVFCTECKLLLVGGKLSRTKYLQTYFAGC